MHLRDSMATARGSAEIDPRRASQATRGDLEEWGLSGGRTAGAGLDAGLDAGLGYGVGAFRGFGAATPCLRYGQAREGERRHGLGWRLTRPAGGFDPDLEAWRRERGPDRPEHGLRPEMRVPW